MQHLIEYGPLAAFGLLVLLDFAIPARRFPKVRAWRTKGVLAFVLNVVIATLLPMTIDGWLGEHRLIDATGLGLLSGTIVAILAYQLIGYWWHRAMHRFPLLWRWVHQMHHSAERVDIFGAFFFHPLDMVGWTLVGSLSMVLLVGVSGTAAGIANLIIFGVATLGHANLRTPAWLGYIIQRPENHALHHQRGVHAYNYADFAVIDMLFGTWKNPASWNEEAGFYDGSSSPIPQMLIGRDIADQGAQPTPTTLTAPAAVKMDTGSAFGS